MILISDEILLASKSDENKAIKGIKPHPSTDGLNPIIWIDPRVEVLTQDPADSEESGAGLACLPIGRFN